jgi:hypothetical protein
MIKNILKNLSNIPGWRTDRKIIVLESDDWGSVRMPSIKAYENLKKANIDIGTGAGARYNKYDSLASAEDLSAIYDVLQSVKDQNGKSAKFTALSLSANPDFHKIRGNNFQNYYYEPFVETLNRYDKLNAFRLWQEGKEQNIFIPEFHGREHLNVSAWMRALQNNDKETLIAFDNEFWAFNRKNGIGYQAAFDLEFSKDLKEQEKIIIDGLNLFENLFARRASFFVPPNGPINSQLEKVAAEKGIKFMSTPKFQTEVFGDGKTKKHFRYIGKKNRHNQVYITRNAFFEPSGAKNNQVDSCMRDVELALKFKKPAVISSHRVNYIGGLVEQNRTSSLRELKKLLIQITTKWPEVEFMSSSELGDTIKNAK